MKKLHRSRSDRMIRGVLANIYPRALDQRFWNHKVVNVLDKLPKKILGQAKRRLQDIVYA